MLKRIGVATGLVLVGGLVLYMFGSGRWSPASLAQLQQLLGDGERLRAMILSHGGWAPFFFVGLQILQVIFFPIPGEASGFLGGYLFGAWGGLFYSTLGLTLGSWLAFGISSLFRDAVLKRMYPTRVYQRFNKLIYKGDFVIPFLLFLLPGFPKDSLSYLLGLSLIPWRVFLFIAAVGRIPGTLMLSFQGAQVYERNYLMLAVLLLISALVFLPLYLYRHPILIRISRLGKKRGQREERSFPPGGRRHEQP